MWKYHGKKHMTYITQKITQIKETNSKTQKNTSEILKKPRNRTESKFGINPEFGNKFKLQKNTVKILAKN